MNNGSSSTPAGMPFEDFVNALGSELASPEALKTLGEDFTSMLYKGFDAQMIRNTAMGEFSAAGILRLVAIGALRGSAAVTLKTTSGGDADLHNINIALRGSGTRTIAQLFQSKKLYAEKNSLKNTGKQYMAKPCSASNHLTVQRLVAAFPDLAAYALHIMDRNGALSERVETTLPKWLVFPAAASLPFDDAHVPILKKMCQDFSKLIGGNFDESIFKLQRAAARPFSSNAVHDLLVSEAAGHTTSITLLQS